MPRTRKSKTSRCHDSKEVNNSTVLITQGKYIPTGKLAGKPPSIELIRYYELLTRIQKFRSGQFVLASQDLPYLGVKKNTLLRVLSFCGLQADGTARVGFVNEPKREPVRLHSLLIRPVPYGTRIPQLWDPIETGQMIAPTRKSGEWRKGRLS